MMRTFVIAEAGVNHNGSIETAKRMIDVAASSGCDAVKFQTFKTENIVTRAAQKANYQVNNTRSKESQYEMLKKLELGFDAHMKLKDYCDKKGIIFLSAPFDAESADMLEKIGIQMFKIPSGEITNKPFLQYISKKKMPIILSTGMSTLGEVENALNWIFAEGNKDVALLHCTSGYPTPYCDVNLKAMLTLREAFKLNVGYSDHTQGIEVAIAAVSLGATIIEKHFTLDRNMDGPDHKASLEPKELKSMVSMIRNVEICLGDGIKRPTRSESDTIKSARKSIVAKERILRGSLITMDKLDIKRPGTGIMPQYIDLVVGKYALRDIEADQLINFDNICSSYIKCEK